MVLICEQKRQSDLRPAVYQEEAEVEGAQDRYQHLYQDA
jgi:hypothetical protein